MANTPLKVWTRQIGTSGEDVSTALAIGIDGSIYSAGFTNGSLDGVVNIGGFDAFLTKYNPNGTKAWTRLIATNADDKAYAVATGIDGSIYVGGYSNGALAPGAADSYLTKFKSDGAKEWTEVLSTNSADIAQALTTGLDGSIYVTGQTFGALDSQINAGGSDVFLTKYGSNGVKSWTKLLGSSANDVALAITTGLNGSLFVAGYTNAALNGQLFTAGNDAFLTRFNVDGVIAWTRQLGSSGNDVAQSVAMGLDGAIYISGYTTGNLDGQTNSGSQDIFLTKYSADGDKNWTRLLGSSGNDQSLSLIVGSDGAIFIAGFTSSALDGQANNGDKDGFLSKYYTDGTKAWTRLLGTSGADAIQSITKGADGSIYLSGSTTGALSGSATYGGSDAFLAKFGVNGESALGSVSYVENTNHQLATSTPSFTSGASYLGGSITFSIASPTATESLSFPQSASANVANGAISVVGSSIYLGNGTVAQIVGSVDATLNGSGAVLKLNFGEYFVNGSFSTATSSVSGNVVTLEGWTVYLSDVKLGANGIRGSDLIAGFATPIDTSPQPTSGTRTSRGDGYSPNLATYNYSLSAGELRLFSESMTTSVGGDVVHGPYVVSNNSVVLESGDSVSFNWRAQGGADAYDVYAYLLNEDTGAVVELLNQTGSGSTSMVTKTVAVSLAGKYKFVFVSGTFDESFGRAAGASLYIDNITVTQANPNTVTEGTVQSIAAILLYKNTSDNFVETTRTLNLSATTAANESTNFTGKITIIPVTEPPVITSPTTPVFLSSVLEDALSISGATVTSLFASRFTDPDVGDSFGGVILTSNAANSTVQGKWQYSTNSGTHWFDVATVSPTLGLALSAATKLRFSPATNFNGSPSSMTVYITDSAYQGGYTSSMSSGSETLRNTESSLAAYGVSTNSVELLTSVIAVKDQPVALNPTVPVKLPNINEDQIGVDGVTVASIFSSRFTDVDADDTLGGIIVVSNLANSTAQGKWQYSTDSGASWTDVGIVSASLGLAISATSKLKFIPVANFNGAPSGLTVYLTDSTFLGGYTIGSSKDFESSFSAVGVSTNTLQVNTEVLPTNDPPTLINAIPDQLIHVGASMSMSVANSFYDLDAGDFLTLSATLADGKTALPNWLKFSPATGKFSGAPQVLDSGKTLKILVTATDRARASVYDSFDIQVSNANTAPVAKPIVKSVTLIENSSFNYSLPVGTFSDVNPGDKLRYSLTSLDSLTGLSINPLSGTIFGKVGFNAADDPTREIVIKATDSGLLFSTVTLNVDVRNVPVVIGTSAHDVFVAGNGVDKIWGKGGRDTLTGGGGADEFNFDTPTALNFPTITDFTPGSDKLRLSLKVFSNLGSLPSGATQTQLNANLFETGSGLSAASQPTTRLFYDQTKSTLYYDPDGTGVEAAKTLVVLSGVTTALVSSDIYIFS